jgi:predicted patatin/cPLA2 family phospholipase
MVLRQRRMVTAMVIDRIMRADIEAATRIVNASAGLSAASFFYCPRGIFVS